jgi:hypothetical protein
MTVYEVVFPFNGLETKALELCLCGDVVVVGKRFGAVEGFVVFVVGLFG